MQFDKGSNLTVSGYVALSAWIYVDKDWKNGDSIEVYGWDTGTSAVIGTAVNLEDYFDWSNFDTWIKLAIPLTDMGLISGTIDALRIRIVAKEGKSPKFYLDDIQFEQTGTPIEFCLEADKGTWLWLTNMQISVAAAYDTDEAGGTLPGIAYDDLLGVSLASGLVYQRINAGGVTFSNTFKQLADWLWFPRAELTNAIHDGTNTFLTISLQFGRDTVLRAEDEDKMRFVVQDDLSGLLILRACVTGHYEDRSG